MSNQKGFVWLPVLLGVLVVLALGGAYVYETQKPAPPTEPIYTPTTSTKISSQSVSTTTPSGVDVTIGISLCEEADRGLCFGSGAANQETKGAITIFDLVSKDCQPSYGVILNRQGIESYYEVAVKDLGTACRKANIYSQLHDLILNSEKLYAN
ncbi:MAG: hypothetical protein Q7S26_04440 [bacterium]|nr:hypothetical protein [bacterium]